MYPRCDECLLSELQLLVTKLNVDPAILQDFKRRPWDCMPRKKMLQPVFIDLEEEVEEEAADDILADTAALANFSNCFSFEGATFSTLLNNNGAAWIRAKEVVEALGYKCGSSTVSHNMDADRHCSLEDLLARIECIAVDFKSTLQNLL